MFGFNLTKTMKFLSALLLAVVVFLTPLFADDIAGSSDNPFLKRFDGSSIVRYKASRYDLLDFIGKDPAVDLPFEGKLIRVAYRVAGASSLEVYRNYESELKSKDFELIRDCAVNDCGISRSGYGPYNSVAIYTGQQGLVGGLNGNLTQNGYYMYGVKKDPAGTVHLSVIVMELTGDNGAFKSGDIAIFVDSIQEKAVENKMVDGTADQMSKQLASAGFVNLYGIYFDTDKTDLKPESKSTLDEVAKLLSGDSSLKLKVVGHTDNVGSAEYNNDLSMRRAQSVVTALIGTYNIAADRLKPFGAGFTQPVASNDTDDGRAKNRRVELIKL